MIRKVLHYTIESEIGAGGMGRIFLAHDERTDRRVALKFLAAESHPDARAGLIREARAAARLSHAGIVTLHAIEDTGSELFLVQEYVKGESLAARLSRGPLTVSESLRLARELAAALAHAHGNGVLHRDLKPDNILLTPDGHYKIADFGIARLEDTTTQASPEFQAGTLAYMAPERLNGDPGDARSDLFALGAVLYEALAGRRAFVGRTPAELMLSILNESPPLLTLPGEEGPPLAVLVERLLAREPQDRPGSADMLIGILDGVRPVPTGPGPPGREGARPRRGGRALLIGVVAAAGVLIALFVALRGGTGTAPAAQTSSVAVVYFDNLADPADGERVGAITGNLLITSLAQAGDIDVLSSQTVLEAVARIGRPGTKIDRALAMAVARRVHAGRLVTGTILQTSPRLIVTTEITDVKSGRVLQAERIEGTPGQTVFDLVDALGSRLVARLSPAGERTRPLEPVARRASGDLAAMRGYVEGIDALAAGNAESARDALRRAVAADSTFAQGWFQLAIAQWWLNEPADARTDIENARRHRDRLSSAEIGVLDGLVALANYDYPRAADLFLELSRRFPEEPLAWYGIVEGTFHSRRYAEAEAAARRTLSLRPEFDLAALHQAEALGYLGQPAAAESILVQLIERHPQSPTFVEALANFHGMAGRGREQLAVLRRALASGIPEFPYGISAGYLALMLDSVEVSHSLWPSPDAIPAPLRRDCLLGYENLKAQHEGRLHAAIDIARDALEEFSQLPAGLLPTASANGVGPAMAIGNEPLARLFADSVEAHLARWDPVLFGPLSGMQQIIVDVQFGRTEAAHARLRMLESRIRKGSPAHRALMDFTWALYFQAIGRPDSAMVRLQTGKPAAPPELARGVRLSLSASILASLGRSAEALATLDTLAGAPLIFPIDAVRLHYRRGQLLETLGRPAEARAAYEEFLRIWAHADRDAPDLEEARAAVRRLGGSG